MKCPKCGLCYDVLLPWQDAIARALNAALGECQCGETLLFPDEEKVVIAEVARVRSAKELIEGIEHDEALGTNLFDLYCERQIEERLGRVWLLCDYAVEVFESDGKAVILLEVERGCQFREEEEDSGAIVPRRYLGWAH